MNEEEIKEKITSLDLPSSSGKSKTIKIILGVLGVLLLLASIPAAVFLVRQRQEIRKQAQAPTNTPTSTLAPTSTNSPTPTSTLILTPTNTPTPLPETTSTPTIPAGITPTITLTPTPTSTTSAAGLPETGIVSPTILVTLGGIILVFLSLLL